MTVHSSYEALVAGGTLRDDPAQRQVLHLLDRLAQDLGKVPKSPATRGFFRRKAPEVTPVRGLYLWGGVGRGKSMLMDMAMEHMPVATRRSHFHAFMQWVHDRMDAARKTGVDDAILPVADELATEVRLLAFDEMQITDVADAMIVGRLFEALFAKGVTVVTTSNRPPDDLYKDGLNRQIFLPFIDLIKTRLEVHEIASAMDYRQTVLAGSPSYFTPIDDTARAQINTLWQGLTQGAETPPLELRIKGRVLEVPRHHNGVGRMGFYDLCGKPLGPADYLAVSEALRVLILEDIPHLSRNNFNEAKRFVTLVDTLYEARTRLICSAAAVPERLYVEGEGSFEFERTASRLREMQGENWGK